MGGQRLIRFFVYFAMLVLEYDNKREPCFTIRQAISTKDYRSEKPWELAARRQIVACSGES